MRYQLRVEKSIGTKENITPLARRILMQKYLIVNYIYCRIAISYRIKNIEQYRFPKSLKHLNLRPLYKSKRSATRHGVRYQPPLTSNSSAKRGDVHNLTPGITQVQKVRKVHEVHIVCNFPSPPHIFTSLHRDIS